MAQSMLFLLAQIIFLPEYMHTTNICTENKSTKKDKLMYILISPIMIYVYVNIFLGLISMFFTSRQMHYISMTADLIVILCSVLSAIIYSFRSKKISLWSRRYYMSIYLTFFLMEMAYSCVYETIPGAILCNVLMPIGTIILYKRLILPLLKNIREFNNTKPSISLFILPVIAEVFFLYRSVVVIYLSERYPEVSLIDIPANIVLTLFSTIMLIFVFIAMLTMLSNIEKEQKIKHEAQKNIELTSEMIKALVQAIDAKDKYTNGHSIRVADYSKMIASKLYDEEKVQSIYNIALLHDIGKIGIADEIINKPGKLTDTEYAIIKKHPATGAEILNKITSYPDLINGALYHHERYDGKGYPFGIKGDSIPEIAALIAVADAYDAMTSKRSYRDTLPQNVVREEIEKNIGKQFHPKFAMIMLDLIDEDVNYDMRQK